MRRMTRRPHLVRAGAGVLIAVAAALFVRAAVQIDATPLRAQPIVDSMPPPVQDGPAAQQGAEQGGGPVPSTSQGLPPGRASVRVPILMYHYIRINPDPRDQLGFNLSVTPADFASQMDWLAANAYHPIDFDDLRGYLLGHESLPEKPVVLTFDDGYRDMYTTAFPILRAHGFKAVSYVVSGFVNSPSYVTTDQLLKMDANGIQIGAHTVSHADLTTLSAAGLRHEVVDSKASLEALIVRPVLDFCYPSGKFNDAVVSVVRAAGFETATTTQPGVSHTAGDRYIWTRVRVSGGESLAQFASNLGQPEPAVTVTPDALPASRGIQLKRTFPLRPPQAMLVEVHPTEGPVS